MSQLGNFPENRTTNLKFLVRRYNFGNICEMVLKAPIRKNFFRTFFLTVFKKVNESPC